MIYFTADLHLGHDNIIRHSGRPWQNAAQMGGALIANINARVNRNDTLYILGDFTMGVPLETVRSFRQKIICREVHLILGNHDKRFEQSGQKTPFSTERDYLEIKHEGHRVCMSHYPFLSWHGMRREALMLHGHIHSDGAYNAQNRDAGILRYDVGVDANGYCPVSLPEVFAFFGLKG